MVGEKRVAREGIIETLARSLEPLDFVYAFWEGGAAAFNRVDEWSDIDLFIVVDDEKVGETFRVFEETLKTLSRVKQKYEVHHPPSTGLFQAFYRLEDVSEYLIVDLAVLKFSSPDKFLEEGVHGNVVFHFNKSGEICQFPLDRQKLDEKRGERLRKVKMRFNMFNMFVQKEINRGNFLEAVDLYYRITLSSLIEVLRIKHNPVHHDFGMRYVHYELPQEVVSRLKRLYSVENEEVIQSKYSEASEWFRETAENAVQDHS